MFEINLSLMSQVFQELKFLVRVKVRHHVTNALIKHFITLIKQNCINRINLLVLINLLFWSILVNFVIWNVYFCESVVKLIIFVVIDNLSASFIFWCFFLNQIFWTFLFWTLRFWKVYFEFFFNVFMNI